ncbi:MAG: ribonuclease P protein component [Rhodothermaceae bacterium]
MKRNSLSKIERLTRKKDFDLVYSTGRTLYSKKRKLKVTFVTRNVVERPGVKFAVGVSKRAGNAVWRNRVKRLLRESYRLNKHSLIEKLEETEKELLVVFSPNSINQKRHKHIKLDYIYDEVIYLIEQLGKSI